MTSMTEFHLHEHGAFTINYYIKLILGIKIQAIAKWNSEK